MITETDATFSDVPDTQSALALMGEEGDTKYIWDPKNPDETQAAKEHFEAMRKKGFAIFKLKAWVKTTEVKEFNPKDKRYAYVAPKRTEDGVKVETPTEDPGRYIAVPPLTGG